MLDSWTITDAASFGRMLGSQAQDIGGGRMVDHVRKTRVDWGATRALAAFDPAVLTGWTGDPAKPTSAEQLAVLDVDGQQVVAAAYYTPDEPLAPEAMKEKADAVFAELWAPLAKQLAAPEGER